MGRIPVPSGNDAGQGAMRGIVRQDMAKVRCQQLRIAEAAARRDVRGAVNTRGNVSNEGCSGQRTSSRYAQRKTPRDISTHATAISRRAPDVSASSRRSRCCHHEGGVRARRGLPAAAVARGKACDMMLFAHADYAAEFTLYAPPMQRACLFFLLRCLLLPLMIFSGLFSAALYLLARCR